MQVDLDPRSLRESSFTTASECGTATSFIAASLSNRLAVSVGRAHLHTLTETALSTSAKQAREAEKHCQHFGRMKFFHKILEFVVQAFLRALLCAPSGPQASVNQTTASVAGSSMCMQTIAGLCDCLACESVT